MFRDKGCERRVSLSGTRDGLSHVKRYLVYMRCAVEARWLLFVATRTVLYSDTGTAPVRYG
jgi:hypothetical protein